MANRTLIGAFDGTYVFRVSRPGYDVTDPALPPQGVAFDSRWLDTAKIWSSGVASGFVQYGDIAQVAIPLGYSPSPTEPPEILCMVRMSSGAYFNPGQFATEQFVTSITIGGGTAYLSYFFVDASNFAAVHYFIMRPST